MNEQRTSMPAAPVAVNPKVPRWFSAAIMRALAKEPDQRFQSAAEFKAALTDDQTRVVVAPSPTAQPAMQPATQPATGADAGAGRFPGTQSGTAAGHSSTHPGSFEPATLDRLTQALAPYLGPIAKVMVNRAARSARSLRELQEALAAELPSADDRRQFLARVRSAV